MLGLEKLGGEDAGEPFFVDSVLLLVVEIGLREGAVWFFENDSADHQGEIE